MADGVASRGDLEGSEKEENTSLRREAATATLSTLGVDSISFDTFPDNQMDTVPLLEIAKKIEFLIAKHVPNTVLTHNVSDVNVDHQRVHGEQ